MNIKQILKRRKLTWAQLTIGFFALFLLGFIIWAINPNLENGCEPAKSDGSNAEPTFKSNWGDQLIWTNYQRN